MQITFTDFHREVLSHFIALYIENYDFNFSNTKIIFICMHLLYFNTGEWQALILDNLTMYIREGPL